jgi:carboxymethylenebutenolidase
MPHTQPDGYLALPSTGTGPAVLVLHAWWGLNDTIKGVCDRLAEAGFVAFAPDLYHGKIATTIPEAEALGGALDAEADRAKADVAAAARFVEQHAGHDGSALAVIGFSLGAAYALDLSLADPERVRSVVVFYGTWPRDYGGSKASYLGHFAEKDPYEPESSVQAMEEALEKAGRPVTFHRYPGVGHWFFEPDRKDTFNQAAAILAWERTLEFLRRP